MFGLARRRVGSASSCIKLTFCGARAPKPRIRLIVRAEINDHDAYDDVEGVSGRQVATSSDARRQRFANERSSSAFGTAVH